MKIPRIPLALFALLALAACQSALLTPSGGVLFSDDFSETGNWPVGGAPGGESAYDDGGYRLMVTDPHYQLWVFAGSSYQDMQVEVSAARLAGPLSNRFGLVCRAADETSFYFFIISSDGYYAIGKASDGEVTLLGQEMMGYAAAISQGEAVNRLRFDCIGTTLTGYVNGQMVAITADQDFARGQAGLLVGTFDAGGVVVHFDDFSVIKP